MIIGFDGSRAFQKDRTGTENYSYRLLKALAKIDRKNQYAVYIRPGVKAGNGWPGNFAFKVIPWPRFWTQGGLALQTLKDPLDVLFVPAHTLPVIRRPGLKTVVTVHDLGSEYLPAMHQLKQRLYLGLMQKFQLKTATKIIAVSKATKVDLVKRIGIKPEKVSVVYEGFDKDLFKPVKGDLLVDTLIQYNLQTKNYFLFVGTVQPRKNLERLIRAFDRYIKLARLGREAPLVRPNHSLLVRFAPNKSSNMSNGVRSTSPITLTDPDFARSVNLYNHGFAAPVLVIAGSKGWLADEIYRLPKELGIEERVKFLGYVPDKDLPALYSGAIALTFPSLFEGFGLPILEAQACGCPVLTSGVSSMPEVAGSGAILVDPYSIDDIVEGMARVQSVKAGFENIKRFSWEKCARETLEVLKSL